MSSSSSSSSLLLDDGDLSDDVLYLLLSFCDVSSTVKCTHLVSKKLTDRIRKSTIYRNMLWRTFFNRQLFSPTEITGAINDK